LKLWVHLEYWICFQSNRCGSIVCVYIYSNPQKRENTLEQCFQDVSSMILLHIFSRTFQVSRCLYDLWLHLVLQGWPWPQHAVDRCIIRHGGHQRNLGTAGSHLAQAKGEILWLLGPEHLGRPRQTPRFLGHVLNIFSAWNTMKPYHMLRYPQYAPIFFGGTWQTHLGPAPISTFRPPSFFPASGRRSSSISAINGERSCQDDNYGFESVWVHFES